MKLRGYRIELGEIETVLTRHSAVRESLVVVRQEPTGEKRLVAYIVAAADQSPTTSELRSYLKQKVPEYMVPTVFVMLEQMPLTPNGKVDRLALPVPDQSRPELEQTFVAPHTPVEEVVAGIWSEVLGVEQVGVHDNFFELGGHSLLATQVISRMQEAFQLEIPLRCMFESPTVAGLTSTMETTAGVTQTDLSKIARILIRLNQLSEDEARMMLEARGSRRLDLVRNAEFAHRGIGTRRGIEIEQFS